MSGAAHRYVLVVDGREIELSDGEVTLGRSRSSTVRVDHESVSRSHALVTFANGTALLKDLNSSNGTFLAGRRILNETVLRSGDRLQIGAAVIEYRLLEPSGPVERTALLASAVASALPPTAPVPAGGSQLDDAPSAPSPLEISAEDLFRDVDDGLRREPSAPVMAAAALAAVHSSGISERPSFDLPEPADAPPPPAPLPPVPPPVPPVRPSSASRRVSDATLSQFPIHRGAPSSSGARPAPEVRVRKPRASGAYTPAARAAAGFFPRLLATLVDSVILLALDLLLLSPVFLVFLFRDAFQSADLFRDWAFLGILGGCGLMIVGANLWYVVGGWARNGRTPGKALLRLTVVPVEPVPDGPGIGLKRALGRFLAWNLSGTLAGIGFLFVLFRKDRRALHDLMAGTKVVRTS